MDSVLKSSILIVQKLALHQNGVKFRQQFNGAIRSSLSAPYNDVRRHASLKTLIFLFFNPSPSSSRAVGVTDLETVIVFTFIFYFNLFFYNSFLTSFLFLIFSLYFRFLILIFIFSLLNFVTRVIPLHQI